MPSNVLVFAGDHFYPSGGWGDYVGAAVDIVAAENLLRNSGEAFDWYQFISRDRHEVLDCGWVRVKYAKDGNTVASMELLPQPTDGEVMHLW